jgi:hypothetical protein
MPQWSGYSTVCGKYSNYSLSVPVSDAVQGICDDRVTHTAGAPSTVISGPGALLADQLIIRNTNRAEVGAQCARENQMMQKAFMLSTPRTGITVRASVEEHEHSSHPIYRSQPRAQILKQESISTGSIKEIQALSDEAWLEFSATLPEGIDYVAEASVRGLIVRRIRRAVAMGEVDKRALRKAALHGL